MTTKIELLLPTLPTDVSGIVSKVLDYNDNVQSISCTTKSGHKVTLTLIARGGISRNPQSFRYTITDVHGGNLPTTYGVTPYSVHVEVPISVKDNVLTSDVKIDMKPLLAAVEQIKQETDTYIAKGGDYDGVDVNFFPPSKGSKRGSEAAAPKRARAATADDGDYHPPAEN